MQTAKTVASDRVAEKIAAGIEQKFGLPVDAVSECAGGFSVLFPWIVAPQQIEEFADHHRFAFGVTVEVQDDWRTLVRFTE